MARSRVTLAVIAAALMTVMLPLPVAAEESCLPRLLVLSAYPGEIDRLLTDETTVIAATESIDGRRFHIGTLRGQDVVLALSGIGLVNAATTAENAIDHFRCGEESAIVGIVFSGVAGGAYLGDVIVPERWTDDDGETWFDVDPAMFATALEVAESGEVELRRDVPTGDLLCVGHDPNAVSTVTLPHEPTIRCGGEGKSTDPFNGRAFPCIPGGGDVFGCEPCRADPVVPDLARVIDGLVPFVDPDFFFGYFDDPPPPATEWDAEDMESAAVARVAAERNVPFIAFRGVSDGEGDQLMLPGFPFQFFYYRQVAADNAARTTLAFLDAWPSSPAPTPEDEGDVTPSPSPTDDLPATGGGIALLGLVFVALLARRS